MERCFPSYTYQPLIVPSDSIVTVQIPFFCLLFCKYAKNNSSFTLLVSCFHNSSVNSIISINTAWLYRLEYSAYTVYLLVVLCSYKDVNKYKYGGFHSLQTLVSLLRMQMAQPSKKISKELCGKIGIVGVTLV